MKIKKYLGFYYKEEKKGLFKNKKKAFGDLTVEADCFAEAQERISKRMNDYGIDVAIIFPVWRTEEKD